MDKIINQSKNGRVFICPNCEKIHIEFFNFLFSFSDKEYDYFKKCFERMDGRYYESVNYNIAYKRKIIVPIGHQNVSMMLNRKELEELQLLLSNTSRIVGGGYFLSTKEIGISVGSN